jgi:acetyl-CoA acyltransferase
MPSSKQNQVPKGRRAVIVGGCAHAVREGVRRVPEAGHDRPRHRRRSRTAAALPAAPADIDAIVWGGVILPGLAPNVGREIALDLKLPPKVEAMTVTRACTSGLQADHPGGRGHRTRARLT